MGPQPRRLFLRGCCLCPQGRTETMRGYGRWQTDVYQTHGGLSELPGRSASGADGRVRWAEGDGSCCPRIPPSPFPAQPRPSLGLSPQSRLPSAIGHHLPSRDVSQVPAPQPGQAWAEVSPSWHPSLPWPSSTCPGPSLTPTSGPPWAALHPRSCHPRPCRTRPCHTLLLKPCKTPRGSQVSLQDPL